MPAQPVGAWRVPVADSAFPRQQISVLNERTLDEYKSLIESLKQAELLLAESEASRRRLVIENQRLAAPIAQHLLLFSGRF